MAKKTASEYDEAMECAVCGHAMRDHDATTGKCPNPVMADLYEKVADAIYDAREAALQSNAFVGEETGVEIAARAAVDAVLGAVVEELRHEFGRGTVTVAYYENTAPAAHIEATFRPDNAAREGSDG